MPRLPSGSAEMTGCRKLKPTADHCAVQHSNDRHLAELDRVEHAVPHPRMQDAFSDVALGQFTEIKAGGKMLPGAVEHHDLDVLRQRLEEGLNAENGGVIERVSLLRSSQAQDRDV